mmetsp:Transcript_37388/g.78853  ORF Transcript_37388/g.78853 Transcript_37388/m.78853 type:complete len:264 (-) Transcript_37388:177-968(-)
MTATSQDALKSILLASPPGQFDIILDDLRSLLPKSSASLLEKNAVATIRSEWETSTGRSGLANAADGTADDSGDGCIASLSTAMENYLNLKFSSKWGAHAAHTITATTTADGAPAYTIATYAERIDLHNHHAGSWKGTYTICPSTGDLSGNISVCAHTFENGGNVQLHSEVSPKSANVGTCAPSDDDEKRSSWAKSVARQIERWEEVEVVQNLSEMFESMGNTYLKSLRRVMPITRTKMEWNVMSHRMLQTLGKGHDKEKFKH